jgi:hypothetical protein
VECPCLEESVYYFAGMNRNLSIDTITCYTQMRAYYRSTTMSSTQVGDVHFHASASNAQHSRHQSNGVEAHPFLTNPSLKPGSSQLWRGPPGRDAPNMVKDLGVRGQGTNVQKWTRSALMHVIRERFRPQNQQQMSGGRGMGGGGGDPNYRPKPPPGF